MKRENEEGRGQKRGGESRDGKTSVARQREGEERGREEKKSARREERKEEEERRGEEESEKDIFIKLVSLDFVWTRDHVKLMTSWFCSVIHHKSIIKDEQ